MKPSRLARRPLRPRGALAALLLAAVVCPCRPGATEEPAVRAAIDARAGAALYLRLCAACHGKVGEGVEGKHPEPLAGDKSVRQLTRYIEKRMPEDEPEKCVGDDAENVARYIHDAFYSPIARARNRPPRIELSRLTVRQYRNAVADLVGGLRAPAASGAGDAHGLRAEYFNSGRPGRRRALERIDSGVRFHFGSSDPVPENLDDKGFSVRWEGAVIAPETGNYRFTIRTDHAARLWLNDPDRPLIDAWVKSGDETEYHGSLFLIDGRAYPLKLEFTSRTQGVQDKVKGKDKPVEAFIELVWRLPGRVEEVIPSRHLTPEPSPEVLVVETPFPPDDRSIGYERGTAIPAAWVEAATDGAIETTRHIIDHLEELAGIRDNEADVAVLREFCAKLVERAFRRPLTAAERQLYIDRQFAAADEPRAAVKRVLLLALTSPRFLHLDSGGDRPDAHAVASRLSFALWDSLPDPELLDAAAAGDLASREQVARHASRMIHDRRTRAKVRAFLHHWLDLERLRELAKDEDAFPGFDEPLASDLRTSLDLFLDDVIWGAGADFRRLLLSKDLYLNGRLARYYGFDLPSDAPFQRIEAGETRAGILSHPFLMAGFAYRDTSSPIHRGVFLVRGVLGRALRPPPEAFTPLPPDLHPDLTTRERVALQTRPQACQGCHVTINSLGFALEHFDAVGRYREEEKGKPIDASGALEERAGERTTFEGARELAQILAASDEVHAAFATQLFHHLVKQPILAYGTETPEYLRQVFRRSAFNVRELLIEIAVTAAVAGLEPLDATAESGYNHRRFKPGVREF